MKKLLMVLVLILAVITTGCGSKSTALKVPSGKNCGENIAYIQAGVDKYKETFGMYPTDVNELLEKKDGKGPFAEVIPACPGGNIYVIDNGRVKEVPPVR